MARTPLVFLNSDAPSHAHRPADPMATVRRYRIPNFVFTLAADERLIGRFSLNAARTISRSRGGGWRSRIRAFLHGRSGPGRAAHPLLAVTHYRVLLFTPAPATSRDPFHDTPYDVVDVPFEALQDVRSVDGILPGGEGLLEMTTARGERIVVAHVPEPRSVVSLIHGCASGYLREDRVPRTERWPQPA